MPAPAAKADAPAPGLTPRELADLPRVTTFSRPLNSVLDGDGVSGEASPAKPGDGSFTSSMEGTFHTQVRPPARARGGGRRAWQPAPREPVE